MLARQLRLWTGLVMAAYVVMHLSNHSLGLLSVDAMDRMLAVNSLLWQSFLGTLALYGSFLVHFLLGLRSLYRRRTLRMPPWEAVQIGLGLLIPVGLAGHVIGTRVNETLLDFDVQYLYVLNVLWRDPWLRVKQPLVLLVVWLHLLYGLHYWLRLKRWYRRALPYLYALAIALPLLALLGYARGAVEAVAYVQDPLVHSRVFSGWNDATAAKRALIIELRRVVPWTAIALIGLTLAARWLRQLHMRRAAGYSIAHPACTVRAMPGQTVLEALRAARVPHASACGGRARCTTCRIRVGAGLEHLPVPRSAEAAALRRIAAAPNVRLACQLRPRRDLAVTPLLAARAGSRQARLSGGVQGREQSIAIMFVDLRNSTALGEARLPYDVVFILNQFFAEMSAALAATGGHYAQFSGDGLMALYGLRSGLESGCREAFAGAVEMARRLARLNERLGDELREPLRIGIGIHSGEAIVGTMGPPAAPNFSAVGDHVNIAARLEAQTKDFDCMLVVSAVTAKRAGIDLSAFPSHQCVVRGRVAPIPVFAVQDLEDISGVEAASR